jgi:type I restriction enzyme S subunit
MNSDLPDDLNVSFLPMKAIEEKTGRFDASDIRKYAEVRKGYTFFQNGDILFAKITPCMENGKIAVVDNLKNGIGFGSTEFHVIRLLSRDISRKILFYYLLQDGFRKDAQRNMTGSAGQLRVPTRYIQNVVIPIPPLNEQHRIVAKVEELFSRLDAGMESLRKVKAQLKRYYQAVLKYAFEGKLTEEWRKTHKQELEPTTTLLERITQERKKNVKRRYNELLSTDVSDLPKLIEGWAWARLSDICNVKGRVGWRGYMKSDLRDEGPFVIGATHLTDKWKVNLTNPVFISTEKYRESPEIMVNHGDVIVAQRGSIGKLALVDFDLGEATINPCVLLLKDIRINNKFLLYLLASPAYQDSLLKGNTSTTTPMITQEFLRNMVIPVASLTEQGKIVEDIECFLSVANAVENIVNQSLKQTEKMRQSILKKAFEGKLLPQDPTDESAENLLEHIKEKKAKPKTEIKIKKKDYLRQMELVRYVK